jgi:hypothetical protein
MNHFGMLKAKIGAYENISKIHINYLNRSMRKSEHINYLFDGQQESNIISDPGDGIVFPAGIWN